MYRKNIIGKSLFLLSLFTIAVLSSCGYRTDGRGVLQGYSSIEVPYIKGDIQGEFTSILIHTLASTSDLHFQRIDADLILEVSIADTKSAHIGYQYFFNVDGNMEDRTVPNEERVSILTECRVVDSQTGKVLIGPFHISATLDADFDAEYDVDNLTRFSLAQLDFIEVAKSSVHQPLYNVLSQRIIDYIMNYW